MLTEAITVPKEGKGVDLEPKVPKTPFRCRHRWALVAKRLVGRGQKGKNPEHTAGPGILLIQTCRSCGCFRESIFIWRWTDRSCFVTRQVKLVPAGEGMYTDEFNLEGGKPYSNED